MTHMTDLDRYKRSARLILLAKGHCDTVYLYAGGILPCSHCPLHKPQPEMDGTYNCKVRSFYNVEVSKAIVKWCVENAPDELTDVYL